jgi:hypothetical protein
MLIDAPQKYGQTSSSEPVFTNCKENPVEIAAFSCSLQIIIANIE